MIVWKKRIYWDNFIFTYSCGKGNFGAPLECYYWHSSYLEPSGLDLNTHPTPAKDGKLSQFFHVTVPGFLYL